MCGYIFGSFPRYPIIVKLVSVILANEYPLNVVDLQWHSSYKPLDWIAFTAP